jgi:hypothetical protein
MSSKRPRKQDPRPIHVLFRVIKVSWSDHQTPARILIVKTSPTRIIEAMSADRDGLEKAQSQIITIMLRSETILSNNGNHFTGLNDPCQAIIEAANRPT